MGRVVGTDTSDTSMGRVVGSSGTNLFAVSNCRYGLGCFWTKVGKHSVKCDTGVKRESLCLAHRHQPTRLDGQVPRSTAQHAGEAGVGECVCVCVCVCVVVEVVVVRTAAVVVVEDIVVVVVVLVFMLLLVLAMVTMVVMVLVCCLVEGGQVGVVRTSGKCSRAANSPRARSLCALRVARAWSHSAA
jgi:hypothetical protein